LNGFNPRITRISQYSWINILMRKWTQCDDDSKILLVFQNFNNNSFLRLFYPFILFLFFVIFHFIIRKISLLYITNSWTPLFDPNFSNPVHWNLASDWKLLGATRSRERRQDDRTIWKEKDLYRLSLSILTIPQAQPKWSLTFQRYSEILD